MCGINLEHPGGDIETVMTSAEIESLADACKTVTAAYRNHPWFRMAVQDSIISVLREVEHGFSPTHFQTAKRIAERIFDIE